MIAWPLGGITMDITGATMAIDVPVQRGLSRRRLIMNVAVRDIATRRRREQDS